MTCLLSDKCWCKTCRHNYDQTRYKIIKSKKIAQATQRRKKILEWVWILKSKPCTDCNICYHPAAMQFDHIGNNKRANISDMVKNGLSKESIKKEIDKCDLVCSNCHAVRTYNRQKFKE